MPLSRRHFAAALLMLTLACAESPMEPGQILVLPAIRPRLVLPPGTTPASFGLVIDSVSLLVEQLDSTFCDCTPVVDTIFADTIIAWPAAQESLQLRVQIPEAPPAGHVIFVYLSYYSGGVVMFQGSTLVDFRRGDIRVPEIRMYYFGPGYLSDDVQLFPGDTAMAPGDTLQFVATAFQLALPLDTAYISWRVSDSTKAKIDHLGRLTLRPGALGSTFNVLASIPNGVMSSSRVSVPNIVTALQKVSGDSQSVPVGQRTPKSLTVRAVDAGGKPVPGARIQFFPTIVSPVDVPDSVVFTDAQGLARSGPIPIILGAATVRARLTGTTQTVDFTVIGANGTSAPILFASDSGASGWQLHRADSLGLGRVVLGYLGSYGLEWTSPRWNPGRTRVAYTSYNNVTSNFDLRLTTAIGDTTATLVSDTYGSGARFSPTGKLLAFACGNLASDFSGYVCTYNGADGALTSLNGAGNLAGRIAVSAVVPGRPNGPIAFAWRPDASTRIAFVRDTASADPLSSWQTSRIYQTNADGTALTALSPKVMDLGNGPLQIHNTMDWSPDGSTIAFSATDTSFNYRYTASLYLLDVASGAVRRLTTPAAGWIGDRHPHFSPDGQQILFYRRYYGGSDYFVVRATGGSPSRITWASNTWGGGDPYYLGGDWAPDGRSVAVAAPNGLGGLAAYRVPLDTYSQADYLLRRVLVGTAGIAGLRDLAVSWGP